MTNKNERPSRARVFDSVDERETHDALVTVTREVTTSRDAARKYLIALGTHTPAGRLTRKYGG